MNTQNLATVTEKTLASTDKMLVATSDGLVRRAPLQTIPTIPVEDVQLNGDSVLDGTTAKIVVLPNDDATATHTLRKLKIGNVQYKLGGDAIAYTNYQTFITAFNSMAAEDKAVGQSVFIETLGVPDLWIVSNNESTSVPYTYTTDAAFVTALNAGSVQVGYYKVNKLEADIVDLSGYVKFTDYPTASQGGVVKTSSTYGFAQSSGVPKAISLTRANYDSANAAAFLAKGTLANVLHDGATALDATLLANRQYVLADQGATFNMVLPASGTYQDMIEVIFTATGAFTPTTSGGTCAGQLPTCESGKTYSIGFEWIGSKWLANYLGF